MNPLSLTQYKLVLIVLGVMLYTSIVSVGSYRVGVKLERVEWQKKENARLSEAAKLAFKAAENNERTRLDNEAKARKVTKAHEDEKAAIRAEFERKSDRLRVNRSVCDATTASAQATGSGRPDGAASGTVALPEETERNLRELARQADEVTAIARGLQKWVRENGFYGEVDGNEKEANP